MQNNKVYVTLQNSINSDGLWHPSISLYYSGCDKHIKCTNCHNPELQNKGQGFYTTSEQLINDVEKALLSWLDTYKTMSLCFLGGEPLAKWNRESTLLVSKYFKEKYKNQICNIFYSWRYLEDLTQLAKYTKYMDYGVLGDFKEELKNINYIPSSSNQYIYDFRNNLKIKPIEKGQ